MFIKTSNGYLINTNIIETIYITVDSENNRCSVIAKTNKENNIALYRDKELQFCQEYIEELEKKLER